MADRLRDIRHFADGCINLDDDARTLKANEHRYILNSIIAVSESAHASCLENIKGTVNVFDMTINEGIELRSGLQAIGACEDVEENAVIFFLADTSGENNHAILRYFNSDSRLEWILKDETVLNFKTDHLITSANRIGDLLYWTDGYFNAYLENDFTPPRKINVKKAIAYTQAYDDYHWDFNSFSGMDITIDGVPYVNVTAYYSYINPTFLVGDRIVVWTMDGVGVDRGTTSSQIVLKTYFSGGKYILITDRICQQDTHALVSLEGYALSFGIDMYFGIDWQTIDFIKWKPAASPTTNYGYNPDVSSNLIRGRQLQFGYVYVYDDNERSVMSPISNIENPPEISNYHASFSVLNTESNYITIGIDTGQMSVKGIVMYVKEGNIGIWKEFKHLYKYNTDGYVLIDSNIEFSYDFYGSEFLSGADQQDLARPFDSVPIVSKHQDLFEKNRFIFANNLKYFPNVDIDVTLIASQQEAKNLGSVFSEWLKHTDGYPSYESVQAVCIVKGTSENAYFFSGVIEFGTFWEPGYDYNLSISCYPYTYKPTLQHINYPQVYPDAFYDKLINSSITIKSSTTTTIEEFLNDAVLALRNAYYNANVIAINNHDYKSIDSDIYTDLTVSYSPNHPSFMNLCTDTQLGFVFEDSEFEGNGVDPLLQSKYLTSVKVVIEKIETRGIYNTWKSAENKKFGIVYYDEAGRSGFVNTSDASNINIKSQIEPSIAPIYDNDIHEIFKNIISWQVDHIPPDWARYWSWVYADTNSYYLYAVISDIKIVDPTLGYVFINVNEFIEDTAATSKRFNVSTYRWQKGDRIRFSFNKTGTNQWTSIPGGLDFEIICENIPGDPYSANSYKTDASGEPIYDADGNKVPDMSMSGIFVNGFEYELYNIEQYKTVVEIYRPSQTSDNPLYYEFEKRFDVIDPHTTNRRHAGQLSDQILSNNTPASGTFASGDAWVTSRALSCGFPTTNTVSFPVERRNFSDYNDSSSINIGLPNIKNINAMQEWFTSELCYGGLFIENTQVNDLSKFLAADYIALPEKFGAINYIKEIGFTLKVIQKYKPSSIYVGRSGLTQADAGRDEVLYASSNTLGTVTLSKSTYGTSHPESCFRHEGNLYGYDVNSGVIWRDSGNGIRSISQPEEGDNDSFYKIKSLLQPMSEIFLTHDVQVFGAYDVRYDLAYFAFVDSTDTTQSFTIAFNEPGNRWAGFWSFIPEYLFAMKLATISWKEGTLWQHNKGTRMNFYGQQFGQKVTTVSNINPLVKKRFLAVIQNSNLPWHMGNQGDVYIPPDDTYKRGQTSLVKAGAFSDLEGTIYAALGKNMTTHQIAATNDDWLNGDDMRGNFIELTFNNESTDEVTLFTIEVDSVPSNP